MNLNDCKYLIVGSGIFGSVIAERIANDIGEHVTIIEKRSHIGGNCYTKTDDKTGIEEHCYGSHIFHTSNTKVWDYINRFCKFNTYRHKVLTRYKGQTYVMPINLSTINMLYGLDLKPFEADSFIKTEADSEGIISPANLEEKAISLIGRPLYEAFIKGYTQKQWNIDPKELPESIITRLPVRTNHNYDYFDDIWQGIPLDGYTAIFNRLTANPLIEIHLNTDFFDIRDIIPPECTVIYTGPIDRFFDYRHGVLGWRTIEFQKEIMSVGDFQGTSVVNYAETTIPYTRIHEFRHYHPERTYYPPDYSIIFKEFSLQCGRDSDPYYPINTDKDKKIYQTYCSQSDILPNVIFGGRLGSYSYLDMDKTIQKALDTYETIKSRQALLQKYNT